MVTLWSGFPSWKSQLSPALSTKTTRRRQLELESRRRWEKTKRPGKGVSRTREYAASLRSQCETGSCHKSRTSDGSQTAVEEGKQAQLQDSVRGHRRIARNLEEGQLFAGKRRERKQETAGTPSRTVRRPRRLGERARAASSYTSEPAHSVSGAKLQVSPCL